MQLGLTLQVLAPALVVWMLAERLLEFADAAAAAAVVVVLMTAVAVAAATGLVVAAAVEKTL